MECGSIGNRGDNWKSGRARTVVLLWDMGIQPGPSCSKLTMSLVNVSLKFQMLISEICQYFC